MTCASCAAPIEKRLNRLDGVEATVNYATETASVSFDAGSVEREHLVDAVEQAGYTARLPAVPQGPASEKRQESDPTAPLRRRLVVSALLSLPVLLMSMIPALQFARGLRAARRRQQRAGRPGACTGDGVSALGRPPSSEPLGGRRADASGAGPGRAIDVAALSVGARAPARRG